MGEAQDALNSKLDNNPKCMEEVSKEEKKRKKKEKKDKKESKKRKLDKSEIEKESNPAVELPRSKDNTDTMASLEEAYYTALQAFKADKTNKDLRRAKTAAKQAWDAAVIASAGPNAEALTCRNCSQLFLFQDHEKFQDRQWDKPTQCKHCTGQEIYRTSRNRSKLDAKQNMCYEFQKTGACSRGDRCKFSHAKQHVGKQKQALLDSRPMCRSVEQGEPCPHGDKCRFRHDKG